jgi:hypothetical protein
MGLMRFLRRQFGGPEIRSAPPPPSTGPASPLPLIVPGSVSPTPQRAYLPASRPAGSLEPVARSAGEAVLHFSERRDARFATFTDPDVRREILRLQEMINQLHRQRRRLREDRDRWERLARELERELVELRRGDHRDAPNPLIAADKFRRAKIVLARLTHPDTSGSSGAEAGIRATVFREFWAEFERIEAEASAKPTRLVGR